MCEQGKRSEFCSTNSHSIYSSWRIQLLPIETDSKYVTSKVTDKPGVHQLLLQADAQTMIGDMQWLRFMSVQVENSCTSTNEHIMLTVPGNKCLPGFH